MRHFPAAGGAAAGMLPDPAAACAFKRNKKKTNKNVKPAVGSYELSQGPTKINIKLFLKRSLTLTRVMAGAAWLHRVCRSPERRAAAGLVLPHRETSLPSP